MNDIKEGKGINELTASGKVLFMKKQEYDKSNLKGLNGTGSRIEEKIYGPDG